MAGSYWTPQSLLLRAPTLAATQFTASHHGSGFLVVAKLCGELPFDFLIVHGESWLSGLYEAALSFSQAEDSKAVIWPWQHQGFKAELELAHVQPELCHRGAGPAPGYDL